MAAMEPIRGYRPSLSGYGEIVFKEDIQKRIMQDVQTIKERNIPLYMRRVACKKPLFSPASTSSATI